MMAPRLLSLEMLFSISQSFDTKTHLDHDLNQWGYHQQSISILLSYFYQ